MKLESVHTSQLTSDSESNPPSCQLQKQEKIKNKNPSPTVEDNLKYKRKVQSVSGLDFVDPTT